MLDPADWSSFRAFAHRVLDDSLDGLAAVGAGPAWQPVPDAVKSALDQPVPNLPEPLADVYAEFRSLIEPFATGNRHPRFLGWVHGNGTASGMLAEMLAAGLNANLGGREHSPVYVERAVIAWSAQIFGFPPEASGILTSGASLANLIAVLVARARHLGEDVRVDGLRGRRLVGYASQAVHRCVPGAFDIVGFGSAALHRIAIDAAHRIDIGALRATLAHDRAAGDEPFMIVANAGTVDVGAVDDLDALADLCANEGLWLHIDGAFGALAILSPRHRGLLRGIERAHSLAFDFHKWLHVPYDAGCVLIRDAAAHRAAFQSPATATYLASALSGTAAGEPWFSEYGPELSRRFRALAIWFAFKEHGTRRLGAAIERNCSQAARLAARIDDSAELKLAAPAALNIVCFRFDDGHGSSDSIDELNAAIVVDVQNRGIAVPSTALIGGRCAIRVNLTNHRVSDADLDATLGAIVDTGRRLAAERRGACVDA
jgi:glutamate/tyrosine decarboxylase-like PLP-dependent enzyme